MNLEDILKQKAELASQEDSSLTEEELIKKLKEQYYRNLLENSDSMPRTRAAVLGTRG